MAPNKASISKKDVESILPSPSTSTNSFDPASIVDILFEDYHKANDEFIEQYSGNDFETFKKDYAKLKKSSKRLKNYDSSREYTIYRLKGFKKSADYKILLDRKPRNKYSVAMKIEERLEKESVNKDPKVPEWKIAMVMGMTRQNYSQLKKRVRKK